MIPSKAVHVNVQPRRRRCSVSSDGTVQPTATRVFSLKRPRRSVRALYSFSNSVIFSAFRVSRNHCLFINTNSLRSLPPIVNLSFWKFFWYFDYFLYVVRIYSLCDKIPDKSSIASLASIYKILFVFTNNFYREFLHLVAKISKMRYNIEKLLYTLTHRGLNQYTNH